MQHSIVASLALLALLGTPGSAGEPGVDRTGAAPAPAGPGQKAAVPGVEILKWHDGKRAVFMLEFDDSCETHVTNAIPELAKRRMVGTFYINPGNGPFRNRRVAWEKEIPALGMEYGNHTATHEGAPSLAEVDADIALCSDEIRRCFPDRPSPRLVSFGRPGGVPWTITPEEQKQLLAKYHLVERPPYFGYPIHCKTREDVLRLVDDAIAKGGMGHHDFHGVGGDWLATPMDIFIALLDKLEANREQVWITDPVSYHKYLTEREGAELTVVGSDDDGIALRLACTTDPAFYDMPLTVLAKLPTAWTTCSVEQGERRLVAGVEDGAIRFPARPVTGDIVIRPAGR